MNADKASGPECLERLALHYAMIDQYRINAMRQESAYGRGIKDFLDFLNVFAVTVQGGEKMAPMPLRPVEMLPCRMGVAALEMS
jgi:hypothetical protein